MTQIKNNLQTIKYFKIAMSQKFKLMQSILKNEVFLKILKKYCLQVKV